MRRRLIAPVVVAALFALSACGGNGDETITDDTVGTLAGVGQLPAPLSQQPGGTLADPITTASTIPRSTIERDPELAPVGDRVAGNRLLLIGDSITASTARRYGGEMCFTLLPQGWAVEVNAEVGRFVDFGERVLERRLRPDSGVDWDAAVVFLGSNYGGDAERYRAGLHEILDRLEPRPTVLVTVTEFRPDRADVNAVIRRMLDFYPEVEVLDWAVITAEDRSLLSADGLHLSPAGRARLAIEVAEAVGDAPLDADDQPFEGKCLSTSFTDDSAGRRPGAVVPPTLTGTSGGGGGGSGVGVGGDGGGASPSTTTRPVAPGGSGSTAPPPPTTTVAPAAPSTTAPTTVAPTSAPETVPTTTDPPPPPATDPPTTEPPPPPATDPPAPTSTTGPVTDET